MSEERKKYAVYSQKQAEVYGIWEFSTPRATNVWCTSWGYTPGCPGVVWDDKVDLGEVVSYVRTIKQPRRNYELT